MTRFNVFTMEGLREWIQEYKYENNKNNKRFDMYSNHIDNAIMANGTFKNRCVFTENH